MKDKQIQHWRSVIGLQEKLRNNFLTLVTMKDQMKKLNQEVKELKGNMEQNSNIDDVFALKSKTYDLNELCKNWESLSKKQDEIEKKLQDLEASPPRYKQGFFFFIHRLID